MWGHGDKRNMQGGCLGTAFPACKIEAAGWGADGGPFSWERRHRGDMGHCSAEHFTTLWGWESGASPKRRGHECDTKVGPLSRCGCPRSHLCSPGKLWTHQQLRSKMRSCRVRSPSIACWGFVGAGGQRRTERGSCGERVEVTAPGSWRRARGRAGEPGCCGAGAEPRQRLGGRSARGAPEWSTPSPPLPPATPILNPNLPPNRDPGTQTTRVMPLSRGWGDTGGPGMGCRALCSWVDFKPRVQSGAARHGHETPHHPPPRLGSPRILSKTPNPAGPRSSRSRPKRCLPVGALPAPHLPPPSPGDIVHFKDKRANPGLQDAGDGQRGAGSRVQATECGQPGLCLPRRDYRAAHPVPAPCSYRS